jgi:ABC-type polysaccharide/polyol phosphate export permease
MEDVKQQIYNWLPLNTRLERIWFIAKTDFKKRYYGSFLGLVWALLNPIFRLAVYYTVFTVVFQSKEENFIFFLFLGLIHYLFFAEAVNMGMKVYQTKSYLMENIQINSFDIYYAGLAASFFGFLFNLLSFLIFRILLVDASFSVDVLLYPVILITLLAFTLGSTLIMSMVWTFFRDIVHIWDLIRLALLWLSGVFYSLDPSATWKTALLTHLTPLPGILTNARALLIYNESPDYWMLMYCLVYSLLILGLGVLMHKKLSNEALEKL